MQVLIKVARLSFDSCIKPVLILNQSISISSLTDFGLANISFESMVERKKTLLKTESKLYAMQFLFFQINFWMEIFVYFPEFLRFTQLSQKICARLLLRNLMLYGLFNQFAFPTVSLKFYQQKLSHFQKLSGQFISWKHVDFSTSPLYLSCQSQKQPLVVFWKSSCS